MALGTVVKNAAKSANNSQAVFYDFLTIPGDAAYLAGGTTGFDATVAAAVGDDREVIGVIQQDCAGYVITYLPANGGTLKMYEEGADGGAADEVANGNYSAVSLTMLVVSK